MCILPLPEVRSTSPRDCARCAWIGKWCASTSWATCSQSPRLTVSVACGPKAAKDSGGCLPTGERYRRLKLCLNLLSEVKDVLKGGRNHAAEPDFRKRAGHSLAVKMMVPDQPGAVKQGFVSPHAYKAIDVFGGEQVLEAIEEVFNHIASGASSTPVPRRTARLQVRVDVHRRRGQERVTKVIDRGIEILGELRQGSPRKPPPRARGTGRQSPQSRRRPLSPQAQPQAPPPPERTVGGTPVKRAHRRSWSVLGHRLHGMKRFVNATVADPHRPVAKRGVRGRRQGHSARRSLVGMKGNSNLHPAWVAVYRATKFSLRFGSPAHRRLRWRAVFYRGSERSPSMR